jgi:hypothetical protein
MSEFDDEVDVALSPQEFNEEPADCSALFNEDPEHAVEQLRRYILEVPLTFEFRCALLTNLKHLTAALAREEHYPQNIKIQLEGSPWNNSESGNRTVFTGAIALHKKRQHLFFQYGKSFEEWKPTMRMQFDNYRANYPEAFELYRAKDLKLSAKKYRECSVRFMKGIAHGIARREKDGGRYEDAHIIFAEAYERIL